MESCWAGPKVTGACALTLGDIRQLAAGLQTGLLSSCNRQPFVVQLLAISVQPKPCTASSGSDRPWGVHNLVLCEKRNQRQWLDVPSSPFKRLCKRCARLIFTCWLKRHGGEGYMPSRCSQLYAAALVLDISSVHATQHTHYIPGVCAGGTLMKPDLMERGVQGNIQRLKPVLR